MTEYPDIAADLPAVVGEAVVIEGAGHCPRAQTPDAVLTSTRLFLAEAVPSA